MSKESRSCCHVEVALLGAKETPQRGVSTGDAPVEQRCFHCNDRVELGADVTDTAPRLAYPNEPNQGRAESKEDSALPNYGC